MENTIKVGAENKNFFGLAKEEVQKNFGEAGIQILNDSIKKLNIKENSSKSEVEKLISDIENKLAKNHNRNELKSFSNELHQKLIMYERFSPLFWNFLSDKRKEDNELILSERSEDPGCDPGYKWELDGLESKILEYLYQKYDSSYILEDLKIKEEELADIIIGLDNKGMIKIDNKNWILTDDGKDILRLEGKILELISKNCDSLYILENLKIKEEDLADIIICLENKGMIKIDNKNWILAEKGREIFEKRENLFKKLKIGYLRGDINSREEYNSRKKELEDIPQISIYIL